MDSETLIATEAYSADKATLPRVSLGDMESKIAHEAYFIVGDALSAMANEKSRGVWSSMHIEREPSSGVAPISLDVLTVCILTMQNGFTVMGKSAPASEGNFDAGKGRRFAYEDAIKQLWPLEGYALREKLAA